jgi:acetyltransferase-like isoleucine patch superfamily enzyme
MSNVKQFWWKLREEVSVYTRTFIGAVPGRFGNALRSRWMRRHLQRLGKDTVFQAGVRITEPDKVSIGSNCNLAPGSFITGGGGVTIGDWVGFGPDVKVWSMNHRFDDPDRPWLTQGWERKAVVIEDDVWLGANVFVMPGVTIGKGAIVSAGAVVNKTIPPYGIVVGNPGRVVGWRKQPAAAPAAAASGAPEQVAQVEAK